MKHFLAICLLFTVVPFARSQDKPTADKPVLRVDVATIDKTPADYVSANKPVEITSASPTEKQTADGGWEITFDNKSGVGLRSIFFKLTAEQYKSWVKKARRIYLHLDSVESYHIKATALGNRMDLPGLSTPPKFSWE